MMNEGGEVAGKEKCHGNEIARKEAEVLGGVEEVGMRMK
jgi:hypothetical protein